MSDNLIEVQLKGLLPTPGGSGVFLGSGDKVMTIFIDSMVSRALKQILEGETAVRPMTHDLLLSVLSGLGVSLKQVVIHDVEEETYFARIHLQQKNELGRKVIEVDSRPSDAIVLACKLQVPIYVAEHVWEQADNMKWAIDQIDTGKEGA